MIGKAPIFEASVGGVTNRFLVDTGSQVSTITETFYRAHLAQTENHLQNPNNWLTIRAANGLTLPYVGYIELDIEVCGVVVPKRGVIVVNDSGERKGDMCGLLGTNVLCHGYERGTSVDDKCRGYTPRRGTYCECRWLSPHFRPRTLDHDYPRESLL